MFNRHCYIHVKCSFTWHGNLIVQSPFSCSFECSLLLLKLERFITCLNTLNHWLAISIFREIVVLFKKYERRPYNLVGTWPSRQFNSTLNLLKIKVYFLCVCVCVLELECIETRPENASLSKHNACSNSACQVSCKKLQIDLRFFRLLSQLLYSTEIFNGKW